MKRLGAWGRRAIRWRCDCGAVNPATTASCLRCGTGPAGFDDD